MSQVMSYSRGNLYEMYKESKPQLAEKFLGSEYYASGLHPLGNIFLAASVITFILLTGICGGFGPTANSSLFWSSPAPWIIGNVDGLGATAGLIMLAVGHCKRRDILAEQLSIQQINGVAGKILIDPTCGTWRL